MRLKAALPVAVLAGALAVGVSACGSSSNSNSSSSATPSAASTAPVATVPDLSKGVSTAVKLDSGFLSALTSLKLTPGVTGTAQLTNGSLVFPITSGNVTYYTPNGPVEPYVQGAIHHDGSGITLTAGGTTVGLSNFTVDPGKSLLYGDITANGSSVAKQAPIFFLDGSTLQPLQSSGNDAILTGTKVEINPNAAALLNKTFGTTAVSDYFLVGVATITIATK